MSELGGVCESRKLKVNVDERSYEVLEVWKWGSNACDTKRKPLEEVDCFKYLGSQVAADKRMWKGCGTQNE